MISNGVECRLLTSGEECPCENCSVEQAVVLLDRFAPATVRRRVCMKCINANDGRGGWPFAEDMLGPA